jgi:osmotically-inducible protein OsmY
MKNDLEIQQDVLTHLKWQPSINASNIGVAVKDGIVTLCGHVDSYYQKLAAENATKKVTGVRAIAEDIQVGVSPIFQKTDAEIAESVLNALKWHSAVPEDKLKVKVDDGFVTLEGEVDWEYQRNSAKNAVSNLLGVKNVTNNIVIKPRLTPTDIKSKISEALHRTATVDAGKVSVDINGTRVMLYGSVKSFAEKDDIEDAVWCAPGVSTIESHLTVEPELDFAF